MNDVYVEWLKNANDKKIFSELKTMSKEEIETCFDKPLAFETAGMRGKVKAGSSCMNIYTVSLATEAISKYLKQIGKAETVVVGYDNRNMSREFAFLTAEIFSQNGIKVLLAPELTATPIVSFVIRNEKASAGVMITASHNPKEYNGYKLYNENGCQIDVETANKIQEIMKTVDMFNIKKANFKNEFNKTICFIPTNTYYKFDAEVRTVLKNRINNVSLVYTPLNGTGYKPVLRALEKATVFVTPTQQYPDANFPTCEKPNPEFIETYNESLEVAKTLKEKCGKEVDFILATDPDADRMGVMINHNGEYKLISGNDIGILFIKYLIERGDAKSNSFIVTSVVSSPIASLIAKENNIACHLVLTGFKNIGKKMDEEMSKGNHYLFGFEESNGYLPITHARDKDSVSASLLFTEMVSYYKSKNMNLYKMITDIRAKYKLYDYNTSINLNGKAGVEQMLRALDGIRENIPTEIAGIKVVELVDFAKNVEPSNFIELKLENEQRVIVRPSGTEPKLKFYITSNSDETSKKILEDIKSIISKY